ncbi:MAG: hypothetical protein ABSG32_16715 [Terriglobia bacterium]|jgi:hypothetical protein
MSLRKSPTLTPALLASNRANAKKSTGPRTAPGKAWSRLNHLRNGTRSAEFISFVNILLDAPPGRVDLMAQALLASTPARHPLFTEMAELSVQTEMDMCKGRTWQRGRRK